MVVRFLRERMRSGRDLCATVRTRMDVRKYVCLFFVFVSTDISRSRRKMMRSCVFCNRFSLSLSLGTYLETRLSLSLDSFAHARRFLDQTSYLQRAAERFVQEKVDGLDGRERYVG